MKKKMCFSLGAAQFRIQGGRNHSEVDSLSENYSLSRDTQDQIHFRYNGRLIQPIVGGTRGSRRGRHVVVVVGREKVMDGVTIITQ